MIGSSENRISYNGNGIATEFAYTFKILEKSDIKVLHVAIDGTEELLTKDYYVDMEKSVVLYPGYAPGAEIPEQNRPPILPVGERLVLYREVPITQESALDKHWPFNVIEAGLDKLTIICQQLFDRLQRSFYVSESTSTNFDPKVPIEAGKTFRVNDDGTGFEVTEDPVRVQQVAVSAKNDAEKARDAAQLARDTAQAWAEENAGTTPSLIGGAKSSKQWSEHIHGYVDTAVEDARIAKETAIKSSEFVGNIVSGELYNIYSSVADMKADTTLMAGQTVKTVGYYEVNDGGGAFYYIRAKLTDDVDDGGSLHELVNGLVAELIIENGTINVKQFGAKGDNKTDDSNAIRQAIICAISRNGNERNLNCEVHFSEGIYCVKKDKLFSDFNFSEIGLGFQIVDGINFRGNGRTSSVIKLITKNESDTYTEKWLYNNESIDTQKFQKINFFNLGFDTDNYDYGNGFKQYSQGGEKQFRFYFCDIALGNVLWCEGAGNADLNRFISCGITAYKDLLTLNNTQSVSHMFVGTDMNIKRNLITVLSQGGGDVSISDCNIEMHELNDTDDIVDEEAYYLVNIPQRTRLGNGNCHYVFSNIRFEMHGTKKGLVKTVNGNFPVDVCFNNCWWGTVEPLLRSVVEIYPSKIITFRNCTLHDNFQFTVNGKYSNSDAASCAGTIIFDSCNVGYNKMLADRIIINESDCYRVKATKCYKLASTSENNPIAQDFDYGWETRGGASVNPAKKIIAIKFANDAWPIPSSTSYDNIIELPINAYITRIYLYRPAISATAVSYQLHIGDYDQTKELASSKLATFNDIHKIDVTDVGKIDFNKLRVWATGDGGTPFTGGYGYIEYI